jgi:hypothetical protein
MKYKIITAITAVSFFVCGTGCRTEFNSPKTVLRHVITQAQKGNLEEAYQYVTPDLYNLMQNLRSDIAVGVYASKQQRKVIETINGNTAYVSVYFRNEENPITFYFKRNDGKWKIDAPFHKMEEGIALEDILPYIEDGDIILSSEDHLSSYYIRSISPLDKRFSHSGIIYKKKGVLSVISAEGMEDKYRNKRPEVMERPIEEYLNGKDSIGIYRAKSKNRKMFSDKALDYVGVPFDFKYTLDNEDELYCTQLVNVVIRETHTSIQLKTTYVEREKKDIILPDSISGSDDFEEIRYIEKRAKIQ